MLYDVIKNLCNRHGISVPKLEEKLNFGAGTISKWKKSSSDGKKSSPSIDKLIAIADYFQVSLDYLTERNSFVVHSGNFTDDEHALIANYRILNDEWKICVAKNIEILANNEDCIKKETHLSA